jgi:hypothetical protein
LFCLCVCLFVLFGLFVFWCIFEGAEQGKPHVQQDWERGSGSRGGLSLCLLVLFYFVCLLVCLSN